MSENIIQPIDKRTILRRSILAGCARALNAIERVSKRFSERGWPKDDRMHIATAACCYVKMGIGQQVFAVAPGTDDPPCWKVLTPRATAAQIVDSLEISDITQSEKIILLPRAPLSIVKP